MTKNLGITYLVEDFTFEEWAQESIRNAKNLDIPYSVEDFVSREWTEYDIRNDTKPKCIIRRQELLDHGTVLSRQVWEYIGRYFSVQYYWQDCQGYLDPHAPIIEVYKHTEVKEVITFTTTT